MHIRNVNKLPLQIAATSDVVEPGESVEVDEDLGKSLLEQPTNWAKGGGPKTTKSKEDDQ